MFFIVFRSLYRSSSSTVCRKTCIWWTWHRTLFSQGSWTKSTGVRLVWRILAGFQCFPIWSTKKNNYDQSFFRHCQIKTLLSTTKSSRLVYHFSFELEKKIHAAPFYPFINIASRARILHLLIASIYNTFQKPCTWPQISQCNYFFCHLNKQRNLLFSSLSKLK